MDMEDKGRRYDSGWVWLCAGVGERSVSARSLGIRGMYMCRRQARERDLGIQNNF